MGKQSDGPKVLDFAKSDTKKKGGKLGATVAKTAFDDWDSDDDDDDDDDVDEEETAAQPEEQSVYSKNKPAASSRLAYHDDGVAGGSDSGFSGYSKPRAEEPKKPEI